MGLLEKAIRFKSMIEEGSGTSGLLKRTLLYERGMGESGLLAKAEVVQGADESAPAITKAGGLLARASFYAEAPVLKRREGLLKSAEILSGVKVPLGVKVARVGLLKRAIIFMEEMQRHKKEKEFEVPAGREKEELEEEFLRETAPEEVYEERAPVKAPVESTLELIEKYLGEKKTLEILNLLMRVFGAEGYQGLFIEALKAITYLGGGVVGILFIEHGTGYRGEFYVRMEEGGVWTTSEMVRKKIGGSRRRGKLGGIPSNIAFRKSSEFVDLLGERCYEIMDERSMGGMLDEEARASLRDFEPWFFIPVVHGKYMPGFILIGNRSLKSPSDKESIILFSGLLSLYMCTYVFERNLREKSDAFARERERLQSILELYRYPEVFGMDYRRMLEEIGKRFDIESAVLTTGWDDRGRVKVQAYTGVSDECLKRYRISKRDVVLKSIIKERVPAIPEDLEKRLKGYSVEGDRFNTFVVVPVVFQGEVLGVMFIHRMKGVTKKLSAQVSGTLSAIAQSLVPFLLYRKMIELEPLKVFESILKRETQRARREGVKLYIVAFTVRNFANYVRSKGFKAYRRMLDRFQAMISQKAGALGSVYLVTLNKVVLLLTERDENKVYNIIKEVKSVVSSILKKEKGRGRGKIPLTFTPQRTVYPLESRTVHDILMKLIG
ncbi:MAG: hypothetical protein ACUVWJ_01790 [Spirochaetota bacterium]